jgi:hypothetical protein
MGKWKVWFLIVLGFVGSLVVWALLGRNLWNATKNVCKCDTSGHKVSFALDIGSGGWATLPQPPPPPADTPADLESVQRFAAASARFDGYRKPLAAICNMIRTDSSGRVIGAITPPEISTKIYKGLQPAEYDRIQAPALGIFNKITPQYRLPYYWYLDPARQEEFNRNIEALAKWIEGAIQRFRSGVKNSRVIELRDTNHYVFIVDEALVVRETRRFLLQE